MKKLILLFILITLPYSCNNIKSKYIDISSSNADQKYYNLTERLIEDDNGTRLSIGIPQELVKINSNSTNNIGAFFSPNQDGDLYIEISKSESKNTRKLTDKEWMEESKKGIDEIGKEGVIAAIPKINFENFQLVSTHFDYKINNKYFGLRKTYFNDLRLKGTYLEDKMATEFYYFTIHNKRKYVFSIVRYGNDVNVGNFGPLASTIAGSIKFK